MGTEKGRLSGAVRKSCIAGALATAAATSAQEAYKAPAISSVAVPEDRQNGGLADELSALSAARPSGDPYEVKGMQPLDGGALFTRKLVFKPGGKLIIVRGRSAGTVRIRADEVVVEGPGAGIFWSRPPASTSRPSERGRAPGGPYGRGPGMPGGAGLDGEPGNAGLAGQDAVDLVLAFKAISGSSLDVDLRGSDGGPGGRGQDGGDGGAGGQGAPAMGSLFDCKSGPGRGGDGGPGGRAGPGGPGGAGGRGGTLVALTSNTAAAKNLIHVYAAGGSTGPSGPVGSPGRRGEGGPEGEIAPPFCQSAGRRGQPGQPGGPPTGPAPAPPPAAAGSFAVVPLSDTLSGDLFTSAHQQ